MKITVLIAGVHDPKWPIAPEDAANGDGASDKRILSPFDEAALEMALRLRDADPEVAVSVRISGAESAVRLARGVAAFNITDIATVLLENAWDQGALARSLEPLCKDAELVLIGREFGDFDDGLVPPMLAAQLGFQFFGGAQVLDLTNGVAFVRESATHEETFRADKPTVVSVTNDRRTRLRKPLMKNVIIARQAAFDAITAIHNPSPELLLSIVSEGKDGRKLSNCRILDGAVVDQAEALAELLWESRA